MPTFKNITIRMANGKTRKQRAQVLKSGKLKFVKNIATGRARKAVKSRIVRTRRSTSKRVTRTAKSKMLRTMSLEGGVEDIGWGFIGFTVLGKTPTALPMTRVVQGLAGHALDRRGKARLVPGILDLITLWLAGGFGGNGRIGTSNVMRQLQKISFL